MVMIVQRGRASNNNCVYVMGLIEFDVRKGVVMNREVQFEKRTVKSFSDYIYALFNVYSKILVVRFDVGYAKEASRGASLDDLRNDVMHMLANMRGKPSLFKHLTGYIIKFEHGEGKGFHAHFILFYDGQKVCKDEYFSMQVGEYWKQVITKGDGLYFSCNVKKSEYVRCGIGMIDHADAVKREFFMKEVLSYLFREKQPIVAFKKTGKEKSIIKGIAPKAKGSEGRPRLEQC